MTTVTDDGSQGPAGQRRRLPLEEDERAVIVAQACLAQRQRRGAESLGAARERFDPAPAAAADCS